MHRAGQANISKASDDEEEDPFQGLKEAVA